MPIKYPPKYYNPNWTKYSPRRKRWEATNNIKKVTPVITSKKQTCHNSNIIHPNTTLNIPSNGNGNGNSYYVTYDRYNLH